MPKLMTSDFCESRTITVCKTYKTTNSAGYPTCVLRGMPVESRGSCIKNKCIAAENPPVTSYDPSNPDCSNAVDE